MSYFSSRVPHSLLALLLLPLAGAAQISPASFGAVTTYSAGTNSTFSQPAGIAVADINGDNKPDLITAHFSSSTVEVLLGTGAGGFGPIITFSTGSGSHPDDLAVADVNGDGKLDIVTANGSGLGAGVLLGTGTGSFGPPMIFSTSTSNGANYITVADVNGDGKPDILTTDTDAANSTAKVLLGTGTGSFGPATIFSLGNSIPFDIVVADVNSDGKLDILTANNLTGTVGVLLGTGTGAFGTMAAFSVGTGSHPDGLSVADVNGDGKPDVLTANGNTGTVAVLLGTGTGGFGTANTYPINGSGVPCAIVVADVNGDGKPDLLTANAGVSTAGVLLGTGTGSFGAVTTFTTGSNSQPGAIAVADVNGDRRPDLLTANTGTNTLGVLLNTGTYTPLAAFAALAAETVETYPNPAHDHLQLKLPVGAVQATLLDALGRVVRQQTGAGPALTLETAGLVAGVYMLRLRAGGATLTRRVVLD